MGSGSAATARRRRGSPGTLCFLHLSTTYPHPSGHAARPEPSRRPGHRDGGPCGGRITLCLHEPSVPGQAGQARRQEPAPDRQCLQVERTGLTAYRTGSETILLGKGTMPVNNHDRLIGAILRAGKLPKGPPKMGEALPGAPQWQPTVTNPFANLPAYSWKNPNMPVARVGNVAGRWLMPSGQGDMFADPNRIGPSAADWPRLNSEYEKY